MPRYRVETVETDVVERIYEVEAEDEEHAKDLVRDGKRVWIEKRILEEGMGRKVAYVEEVDE